MEPLQPLHCEASDCQRSDLAFVAMISFILFSEEEKYSPGFQRDNVGISHGGLGILETACLGLTIWLKFGRPEIVPYLLRDVRSAKLQTGPNFVFILCTLLILRVDAQANAVLKVGRCTTVFCSGLAWFSEVLHPAITPRV